MSAIGWAQGVYCSGSSGTACNDNLNTCHYCPACNVVNTASGCGQNGSDLVDGYLVNCGTP